MTKIRYNKILVAILAFVGLPLATLKALGQDAPAIAPAPQPPAPAATLSGDVCANFDAWNSALSNVISNKESALTEAIQNRETLISTHRTTMDATIAGDRADAAKVRDEAFARVDKRAQSTAEKTAAQNFKAAVQAALNARRAAIDAARTAFRAGIDQIIQSRTSAETAVISAFKKAESVAVTKAKSDCSHKVPSATVKANLRTALKNGRETFITSIAAIKKSDDAVKALLDARIQLIQKAQSDFQMAIENARTQLKAAFNEK